MIEQNLRNEQLRQLSKLVQRAKNIVITCHVSPDGDAVGSSLGLMHLLSFFGKKVHVVTPDLVPVSLKFLHGYRDVVVFTRQELFAKALFKEADLIFCMDFNAQNRVDRLNPLLKESEAKKILIDHHLDPEQFCDITFSDSTMSSTCEYLYTILSELDYTKLLTKAAAECIFTGMMTDTGNFSYNSNKSSIYRIIAELVDKGVDKDRIYNLAMNVNTIDQLRINGYALSEKMQVYPEKGAAVISLTHDDLQRFHYQKGDTEGLVNKPLSIPEVFLSIYLREDSDFIKISARSQGDFAVNTICERYFNGGGHKNAAGGEFYGTLDEALAIVNKIIEEI